jgi:hypothetical protein
LARDRAHWNTGWADRDEFIRLCADGYDPVDRERAAWFRDSEGHLIGMGQPLR